MTVNYDYVETDKQIKNLLCMIEEADKLKIYTENSLEVLKTVLDWKKRRAIRNSKDQWNSSRVEYSNARTSFESSNLECCSNCFTAIHYYAFSAILAKKISEQSVMKISLRVWYYAEAWLEVIRLVAHDRW
jgi:hypothetical protein